MSSGCRVSEKEREQEECNDNCTINEKVMLAPMVGGSELAFRMMIRKFGNVQLCYSPMLRANEVIKAHDLWKQKLKQNEDKHNKHKEQQDQQQLIKEIENEFTGELHEDGLLLLKDSCADDQPLVVQLCGCNPKFLYEATKAVLEVFELVHYANNENNNNFCNNNKLQGIDFNLGCPQKCASDGNFGAFLAVNDPMIVFECVSEMKRAIIDYYNNNNIDSSHQHPQNQMSYNNCRYPTRLSCKIRLFDTIEKTISFAKGLEKAGCDILSIHCRQRTDKHNGKPNLCAGKELVEALNIPVIINGSIIISQQDIRLALKETNAYGIMIARAFLENPFLLAGNALSTNSNYHINEDIKISNNYQTTHTLNVKISTTDIHSTARSSSTVTTQTIRTAQLAAIYLSFCESYPPPTFLYIQKHLRWIFRKELQPPKDINSNGDNNDYDSSSSGTNKIMYSDEDWKPRLWTFLVRPYLTNLYQFRQVVALYVYKSGLLRKEYMSIVSFLQNYSIEISIDQQQPITFQSIRRQEQKNNILDDSKDDNEEDVGLCNLFQ